MTSNFALADEIEAVTSIFDADTLILTSSTSTSISTILKLPTLPFSFSVTFPQEYPDVPPHIDGTQSTGPSTKKGDGDAALTILRDVLGSIYTPGQVCLFDLIEEVTPLLQQQQQQSDQTGHGAAQDHAETFAHRSGTATPTVPPPHQNLDLAAVAATTDTHNVADTVGSTMREPNWTLSQPLLVSKSSFIARAVHVDSLGDATSAIGHLLATNKKVASATHNITAWRIKSKQKSSGEGKDATEITVQDSDDDGETAAGGRLLHLMQLMDVWNVVVVVTRWYGGVKLGPDRFRCINMVARDALVKGGFAKEEGEGTGTGKGKGKKK